MFEKELKKIFEQLVKEIFIKENKNINNNSNENNNNKVNLDKKGQKRKKNNVANFLSFYCQIEKIK